MRPQDIADTKIKWMPRAFAVETDSTARDIMLKLVKAEVEPENWTHKKNTSQLNDTFFFRYKEDYDKVIQKIMNK